MAISVDCINKSDRYNPWERITHIGGVNPDNSRWKITQESAISGIESGTWQFCVQVGLRTVSVIVAQSQNGNKYLKTEADTTEKNNLLSLRECP